MDEPIRTREHTTFEVAADRFFIEGRLQIYDEIQKRGYFQIRASGERLVFQAGGFIGLIPINDRVTIDVAPRTPIANIDRMLRIAKAETGIIRRITRSYAETEEGLSLVDVLADELTDAIEKIAQEGRLKSYEWIEHRGSPRSGRILLNQTLRERAAHPGFRGVVSGRHERTANNVSNAILKCAIERLAASLYADTPRKGTEARLRLLNEGWQMFASVNGRMARQAEIERVRRELGLNSSEAYRKALAVSVAILSDRNPSAADSDGTLGTLTLSSLIYDLSKCFEAYVRNVLVVDADVGVLDGNVAPPAGAKRKLFIAPANQELSQIPATPDILLVYDGIPHAVIDVKYKIFSEAPGRDDLNQVLTYGLVYGVEHCVLIYPATDGLKGLLAAGKVGSKNVYCYGIDLAALDIEVEEAAMRSALAALMNRPGFHGGRLV